MRNSRAYCALFICSIVALALLPTIQAAASSPSTQFANWAAWKGYISKTPTPQAGCFSATYPSTVWRSVTCAAAPHIPLQPPKPSTAGNGNDWVANSGSTIIGSSTGSFSSVTGLTSETDSQGSLKCGAAGGANCFGLQDNSQFFPTDTLYTGNKQTTGWEQFVAINNDGGQTDVFIQYWLLNYGPSCPSTGPPGGSPWYSYYPDCYANSPATEDPSYEPATNLAKLTLEGFANVKSMDEDLYCINGGGCYSVSITDQVVDLYKNWQYSEFNVFGFCCGSQANFNSGTSITVVNTLQDQSGNAIPPTCVINGWTGETNNLNLGSCSGNSNGQMVFTESNGAAAFTYSLSNSGGITVTQGSSGSNTITATLKSGSTQSVTLSCPSGLPTGASCSFNPASGSPTFSSTLTISTSSSTPTGTYTITVNGSPAATAPTSFLLTVNPSSGSGGVTMTVSYSIVGGGIPTAPVFHYVLNGAPESVTLTMSPNAVSVDSGSAWSVTPNPLTGSSSSQRWYSTQKLSGTASATTLVFTFQHQYYLTMKVSGPGTATPSSGWHNSGVKVTITARANSSHKFIKWTGTGTGSFTGTTNPATITVNSAITETATFT